MFGKVYYKKMGNTLRNYMLSSINQALVNIKLIMCKLLSMHKWSLTYHV